MLNGYDLKEIEAKLISSKNNTQSMVTMSQFFANSTYYKKQNATFLADLQAWTTAVEDHSFANSN